MDETTTKALKALGAGAGAGFAWMLPAFLLMGAVVIDLRSVLELLVWTMIAPWYYVPAGLWLLLIGAGIGSGAGFVAWGVTTWRTQRRVTANQPVSGVRLARFLAIAGDVLFVLILLIWLANRTPT